MAMVVQTQKKAKNIEKRREKSRYAARHRREKEAAIYSGLYKIVPIVQEPTVTHMDRIAVLRLASCFCRSRFVAARVLTDLKPPKGPPVASCEELEIELAQLVDGFLFMVDSNGLITYISQGVSSSLGLTQTDLIGHNLFEYIHHEDHSQLNSFISGDQKEDNSRAIREAILRVKSVLTARGRNLNLRSAIYKTISFSIARLPLCKEASEQTFALDLSGLPVTAQTPHTVDSDDEFKDENDSDEENVHEGIGSPPVKPPVPSAYYLLYGMPILCPSTSDKIGDATCFVTRHSMDMKISYCHERISDILGYDVKSLVGISFFTLVHADDLMRICEELKTLQQRNQAIMGVYRLMAKGGGFVWMYSEASLVSHNTRGHKGQYVVCMHQLIGVCDTSVHNKLASSSLKSQLEVLRDDDVRKYRLIKDSCGMVSPEMLSPDSIPSLTSDGDSPYHNHKKTSVDSNGGFYPRGPSDCLCDINDQVKRKKANVGFYHPVPNHHHHHLPPQFDDLALLAPFVAPDEVLSLEIPLEPFDANCPEVVDFCNEMRADPEFALYLNNFVVDDEMNHEFVKIKEGFLHGNPLQKEMTDFDAEVRKHQLQQSQSDRPEKKLRDFSPAGRLDFFNGNPARPFYPAKPSPMFQTYPTSVSIGPLMSNRPACLPGRPLSDGSDLLSMRGGLFHSPCTIPTLPAMKLDVPDGPIRCKSGGNPYMTVPSRYGGANNNCPTPPYGTMLKEGGGVPGFSGLTAEQQRKRKFSACTEGEMCSDGRICGTLWRPQKLSSGAEFDRQILAETAKSRKRAAYPGGTG